MREILFRGKDKDGHWHNDVDAYVRQKLIDLQSKCNSKKEARRYNVTNRLEAD